MFSAKDERNSLLATLWFNVAHYALRPWPWVIVGMASVILYPHLQDPETGYVRVMIDYLPASLRGLMVAAFAAAFMSTVGTQLNWGASYLVNDFYRRFIQTGEPERHYVRASQVATVILTIISAVVTHYMDSIAGAWKLLIVTGAGTGSVLILRWYWWRINAWSEVSAMASAFVVSIVLQTAFHLDSDNPVEFAYLILITVAVTTVVWLAATFLTAPETDATLVGFYTRVRPSVAGWSRVARLAPAVRASNDLGWNLLDWLCGCVLIYGALFGIGKIVLKDYGSGFLYIAIAAAAAGVISWDLSRRGWSSVME
jgi:Na+/proline symporter